MNVEPLLSEVSPEAPAGENLEYDPEYLELMREAQGVPEHGIGDTFVAAVEPNWRDVRDHSVSLFSRTKDLAVGLRLTEALLKLEGLPGFRDGLALINGLLGTFWDTLYPQLDPDDGNDPTLRLNILAGLTDSGLFLSKLRAVPLTNSISAGRFGLRDIAWATGRVPHPEEVVPPKAEMIEAAFKDTDAAELQASAAAVEAAIELVKAIDGILGQRIGAARGVEFEPLLRVLGEIRTELRKYAPGGADGGVVAGDAAGGGATGDASRGGTGGNGRPSAPGEVRSPEDVIAAIDRICDYYARLEPSSPVPLLLRRAQRLVGKGFLDIVRDLSPEVVRQIETLGGIAAAEGT
jgi:type VI secretion system protein ImpA